MTEGLYAHAILLLDPSGMVTGWNAPRAAHRRPEGEIPGQSFARFHPPEERDARRPEQLLWRATRDARTEEEGLRVRRTARVRRERGPERLRDGEGRLAGFAHVMRDVTERGGQRRPNGSWSRPAACSRTRFTRADARAARAAASRASRTGAHRDPLGTTPARLVALAHPIPAASTRCAKCASASARSGHLAGLARAPLRPAGSRARGDAVRPRRRSRRAEHRDALRAEGLRAWVVVPLTGGGAPSGR